MQRVISFIVFSTHFGFNCKSGTFTSGEPEIKVAFDASCILRKVKPVTDYISYPLDSMSATSRSLTSFIEDQWQQHTALFMANSDSHAALLQAIAKLIPGAGGKDGELATALNTYHNQYQVYYQALHDLAIMIDSAAQAMGLEDQQTAQGFQQI